MLGHTDVSITLSVYSHVLPDMQDEAAKVINSFFAKEKQEEFDV